MMFEVVKSEQTIYCYYFWDVDCSWKWLLNGSPKLRSIMDLTIECDDTHVIEHQSERWRTMKISPSIVENIDGCSINFLSLPSTNFKYQMTTSECIFVQICHPKMSSLSDDVDRRQFMVDWIIFPILSMCGEIKISIFMWIKRLFNLFL